MPAESSDTKAVTIFLTSPDDDPSSAATPAEPGRNQECNTGSARTASTAAAIASVVLGLLGNLDIVRLARNVGQLQEVAWQVLESHNLMALTQLLPIALDLASVALGVLEPGAKMSPDLLGAGATPQQQALATASQGQDMAGMFGSLTQLVSSQGAQDLSKLVGEGLTAATFYASNAHGR